MGNGLTVEVPLFQRYITVPSKNFKKDLWPGIPLLQFVSQI